MMRICICKDYNQMSVKAADIIQGIVKNNQIPKLGLATGSTPEGMYQELVKRNKEGLIDFSNTKTVNLDEYLGIESTNPCSYHYYMDEKLFDHINIKKENAHVPEGKSSDPIKAASDYNDILDSVGRRDVQIIGVGENGHIAFNEPADKLHLRTSVIELTQNTIEVNSRFFNRIEDVPNKAISMGIADLLDANLILLMISGKNKQGVVKNLLECQMLDTHFPVSMLYTHPNVILLVDEEAMEKVDDETMNKEIGIIKACDIL